ncbi:hypothetical protein VTH06DRAFT_787 [Thermothelomyces fergusii]
MLGYYTSLKREVISKDGCTRGHLRSTSETQASALRALKPHQASAKDSVYFFLQPSHKPNVHGRGLRNNP